MRRKATLGWCGLAGGLALALAGPVCCKSSPRWDLPPPITPERDDSGAPVPPPAPGLQRDSAAAPAAQAPAHPAESGRPGAPEGTQPGRPVDVTPPPPGPRPPPPEPAEPELPEFIEVRELFTDREPSRVRVEIASPNRLVIDTRNVRRLRIYRDKLPMDTRRSIALLLDGEGIEWTAGSTAFEFERSPNGDWSAVRRHP